MLKHLLINNRWYEGKGNSFSSVNPATDEILWEGQAADVSQIDFAISAARKAFLSWADQPFPEREKLVLQFVEELDKNAARLAEIISKETGKPLWESHTEVTGMKAKAHISIDSYHERTGTKTSAVSETVNARLQHKPHGVVAIFGPYNFPGHLPNGHIIPALLAGNTVILKPSELTPLVSQEVIQIWMNAGLPEGVINLLQGMKDTGVNLSQHPGVDGIFFTGSSQTGHILHEHTAGNPEKILALEMGGNNPLVVGDISDLTAAAYEIVQSAFITSGQRCTCARRLYVPGNEKGDRLLEKLVHITGKLQVGLWNDDPQPFLGAMISKDAAFAILNAQESLIMSGAEPLLEATHVNGNQAMITPGILDVTSLSDVPDQEYFGPLLQVTRYKMFEQAVELANKTRYGLSAGIFSDDRAQFKYFHRHIRAGIVNWNKQITGASATMPFGGVGASGNHRPGAYYAADYCAYPVAGMESDKLMLPSVLAPGIQLED